MNTRQAVQDLVDIYRNYEKASADDREGAVLQARGVVTQLVIPKNLDPLDTLAKVGRVTDKFVHAVAPTEAGQSSLCKFAQEVGLLPKNEHSQATKLLLRATSSPVAHLQDSTLPRKRQRHAIAPVAPSTFGQDRGEDGSIERSTSTERAQMAPIAGPSVPKSATFHNRLTFEATKQRDACMFEEYSGGDTTLRALAETYDLTQSAVSTGFKRARCESQLGPLVEPYPAVHHVAQTSTVGWSVPEFAERFRAPEVQIDFQPTMQAPVFFESDGLNYRPASASPAGRQ